MKIGYARVSTDDQTLALQQDALKAAGCERVLVDVASGKKNDRAGLMDALTGLSEGDVLVVWKLDRLGRNAAHLLTLTEDFRKRGVEFVSIKDGIDTSTPGGKMFCGMLAVFAEFERDTIVQRTKAGLAAAKARGRIGGRKRVHDVGAIREAAKSPKYAGNLPSLCRELGISRATYFRAVKEAA